MAFTRADVISRARILLNNTGTEVLTAARLYSAFNDVQRDWAERTKALSGETTLNLVANQTDYDLRTLIPRLIEVRRVYRADSNGGQNHALGYYDIDRLPAERNTSSGSVTHWTGRGTSKITLYPKPSSSVTNGITVDAYLYPADLAESSSADATSLEFPNSHRQGLIYGMALWMCMIGLEDPTLSARYPVMRDEFEREAAKIAQLEADPGSALLVYAGDRPRRHGNFDRAAYLLPPEYGVDH